jgi:hypothetical protein
MAKARVKVRDYDHGWRELKKRLPDAAGAHVKVGLPTSVGKEPKDVESRDGAAKKINRQLTLAMVGWWNEFGTKDADGGDLIPPRSFLRSTHDENLRKLKRLKTQLVLRILDRELTVRQALEIMGQWFASKVRDKIVRLKTPKNAESTLRRKFPKTNPLIDIGQLHQSITHEVVLPKRPKTLPKAVPGRDSAK